MTKKYYVVWQGRERGIFTDWNSCKKQVDKFTGAKYKSFPTKEEAEAAFSGKYVKSTKSSSPRSTSVKKKTSAKTIKTYTASDIAKMKIDTKIFTDGGCEPNPGKAGSGIAVYRDGVIDELWHGLYNPMGTNNTAELNALYHALLMAQDEIKKDKSVAIFCDSKYSIQCVTMWALNWERKGWKKQGGEIKNLELIKKIYALHQLLKKDVKVLHVNGHVGIEGNELADRMSILAVGSKCADFTRYNKSIDIDTILAMRTG